MGVEMRSRRPRGKEEVDAGDRGEERKLLTVKRSKEGTADCGSVSPQALPFTNHRCSTANQKKKNLNLVQPPVTYKAFSCPSSYLCEVRKRDVEVPILPLRRLRLSEFGGLAIQPVMGKAGLSASFGQNLSRDPP